MADNEGVLPGSEGMICTILRGSVAARRIVQIPWYSFINCRDVSVNPDVFK